jgi:hypothetical protein
MINMRGNICIIDLTYKNDQYSILSNTITIVDANEPEMLSSKLFSEYVKINCARSLNHFPIQNDIGSELSKTVNYIHINGSNKSLSNSVGGSVV